MKRKYLIKKEEHVVTTGDLINVLKRAENDSLPVVIRDAYTGNRYEIDYVLHEQHDSEPAVNRIEIGTKPD